MSKLMIHDIHPSDQQLGILGTILCWALIGISQLLTGTAHTILETILHDVSLLIAITLGLDTLTGSNLKKYLAPKFSKFLTWLKGKNKK